MSEPLNIDPASWPDGLPPCLIRVDVEGRFWHQGAEMVHAGINKLLMDHVDLDEKGRYVITFAGQRCFVEVEDTFFVVVRAERVALDDGKARYRLTLNDGGHEWLAPATLRQSPENILYARVREGRFPARFLRPAYYQLAEHVEERNGAYMLKVEGRGFPIAR